MRPVVQLTLSPRPDQRVALVTGANKGIGLEIARGLARAGSAVLVGSRDERRGRSAVADLEADGTVALLLIDVSDADSVRAAADTIENEVGRLDVVVNNAGVKHETHPCAPSEVDLDLVRDTFDTNVFGTMQVIQAMLPLLRRSPGARVVNVSSGLGSLTLATTDGLVIQGRPLLGYNSSKAALNSVTVQFANELRDTGIKVNAVDPGFVRTDMTRAVGVRTDAGPERLPKHGAAKIIELALVDDDGPTGGFFNDDGPLPW